MKLPKRPLAFYISAHGFGHGVRSCDIIRAYKQRYPDWPVHIISGLNPAFFHTRLGSLLGDDDWIRQASFDVGMVQQDAIRTDVDATLGKVMALCANAESLIREEREFLRRCHAGAVVADIPGIPLAAAASAEIPAIAVSNFSWDWIYAPFVARDARWQSVVEHFQHWYRQADLLLRLPFPCPTSAFRRVEDLPLLASPGMARRAELAEHFNADSKRQWVLLALTSLSWDQGALEKFTHLPEYEFFVVKPFDWSGEGLHVVDPNVFPFSDVIASMDVVISKPGFGIVSDCIANGKPLIYADRGDFPEYAVLVEAIGRYLRQVHIPAAALYAGDMAGVLHQLQSQPEPQARLAAGGAKIAARRIHALLRD